MSYYKDNSNKTNLKIKPHGAWFVLPVIIFIIGAVLTVFSIINMINSMASDANFSLSNNTISDDVITAITIDEPGKYEIFYDYYVYDAPPPSSAFSFINLSTGNQILSERPTYQHQSSFNGLNSMIIATVQIDNPGEYSVKWTSDSLDWLAEERSFSIKQGNFGNSFVNVLSIIGSIFLAVFGTIICLIVLIVKRVRSKAKIRMYGDSSFNGYKY